MKETKGEESIVLVIQIKEEERRVREIERWVLGKKGVLPTGYCSSNSAYFSGKVRIFSIWVIGDTIQLFGL